jgi:hypothetical protein
VAWCSFMSYFFKVTGPGPNRLFGSISYAGDLTGCTVSSTDSRFQFQFESGTLNGYLTRAVPLNDYVEVGVSLALLRVLLILFVSRPSPDPGSPKPCRFDAQVELRPLQEATRVLLTCVPFVFSWGHEPNRSTPDRQHPHRRLVDGPAGSYLTLNGRAR